MHINLLEKSNYYQNGEETAIGIRIKTIGEQEYPTGLNSEDEMKNIETLHSGEFGIDRGFSLKNSEQVKSK